MRYRRIRQPGASYFFTVVTDRRRPVFADPHAVALFQRSIAYVKRYHPFQIDAFVILPDHLHMMWTLPDGDAEYPIRWQLIKATFTREFLRKHRAPHRTASRMSKGEQAVWQRRFWEHLIRDEDDFSTHLDYIHLNPVQHGLAILPGAWPHSSFRSWAAKGYYADNWGDDTQPILPGWAKKWDS